MKELLSVVIPIYNVDKYLDQCIESIVKQSYTKLQIILVDDGSTDSCPQKCDEWANKDQRIVVIHKSNGGLSDARNAGIKISSGRYLAFVDSDDFIDPNMYSNMIESLEKTQSDIAVCGRYLYSETVVKRFCLENEKIFYGEEALRQLLRGNIINEAAWDKVYKRELFEDLLFPVGEINEDIVVMPQLFDRSEKIVHVGKPLYYYRFNPNSITQSLYSDKKHVMIDHVKFVSDYIMKKRPGLTQELLFFKGRYALNGLLAVTSSKDGKANYKMDFDFYLKLLRDNYLYVFKDSNYSTKEKILVILNVLNIYNLLKQILGKNH